ncbi:MAG: APC family permease [Pseudomonadota bacterium]
MHHAPPKRLNGPALYFLTISTMVGSSWLFSAMYSAQFAGPAGIISIAIGGLVIFIIAMVYAEIGGLLPVSGASARIPYATHGDFAAFTASLLNWLGYLAVAPLEVMAIIEYLSAFAPMLAHTERGTIALTPLGIATCIPLLFAMVLLNSYGVKVLARANTPLAVWKLAIPIFTIVVFLLVRFEPSNFTDHGGFAPFGMAGILGAVTSGGAILAFLGFRATIELAGEAHRPERTVPLTIFAAMSTTVIIYILLSVVFVGALSEDQLAKGWASLSDNTGAGPFAQMAIALGLSWFALVLFIDAGVSPGGTALVSTGIAARLNRAMAQNGHAPARVARLNRHGVPGPALWVNFGVALVLLLPFPGWQAMMTLVSSSLVLSLGLGSLSMIALRAQAPDAERRYRLPAGVAVAALAFLLANYTVYWAGWNVVRLVVPFAVVGILALPILARLFGGAHLKRAEYRALFWLLPWLLGLLAVSRFGNYGGGTGALPAGVDLLVLAAVAGVVLMIAHKERLPADLARARLDKMRHGGGSEPMVG